MVDRDYRHQKHAIRLYANDMRQHAPEWKEAGFKLKGAKVDWQVFTACGTSIFNAYESLVDDYAWNAWRISCTLERVAHALDVVEKTYGKAEATTKDDINSIGKQF